ncbi:MULTISPECIES: hypothetical protein [Rhizobium]|nr:MULTISPECIES: hypothetical protein [Rhizobium]
MMRKLVFGAILALVALSVVFSLIGVLAIWSPMELFAPAKP